MILYIFEFFFCLKPITERYVYSWAWIGDIRDGTFNDWVILIKKVFDEIGSLVVGLRITHNKAVFICEIDDVNNWISDFWDRMLHGVFKTHIVRYRDLQRGISRRSQIYIFIDSTFYRFYNSYDIVTSVSHYSTFENLLGLIMRIFDKTSLLIR